MGNEIAHPIGIKTIEQGYRPLGKVYQTESRLWCTIVGLRSIPANWQDHRTVPCKTAYNSMQVKAGFVACCGIDTHISPGRVKLFGRADDASVFLIGVTIMK